MHPTQHFRAHERIVDDIAGYPVDARMQRQMIERAKNDGVRYSDVADQIRQIVTAYGADDTRADAEIEVYLARGARTSNEPGLKRKKRKATRFFEATATVSRERVLPDRSR